MAFAPPPIHWRGSFARDKETIQRTCQLFIDTILKPRFLREIRPHPEFNYPIDILGKWRGTKYRFVQRYHTRLSQSPPAEFDAPFARLEYVGENCFDLSYCRHTGQWWCLYRRISFAEALRLIEGQGHFHPP